MEMQAGDTWLDTEKQEEDSIIFPILSQTICSSIKTQSHATSKSKAKGISTEEYGAKGYCCCGKRKIILKSVLGKKCEMEAEELQTGLIAWNFSELVLMRKFSPPLKCPASTALLAIVSIVVCPIPF